MDSKEKSNFINKTRLDISKEEKGLEFFIEEWKKIKDTDKESLTEPLLIMCQKEMQQDIYISSIYFEFQNVVKYILDETEYKTDIKKFNLSNTAKGIDIVNVFYKLKQRKYIDNTNEDTANLISKIFDINYKTAYSYLKTPKRLENARDLLH